MATDVRSVAPDLPANEVVGQIESLQICPGHREPMQPVESVEALAERGLQGDAHNRPRGTRQVLLMDAETLEAFHLGFGVIKENITTRGLAVNQLTHGQRLQIGDTVVLEITDPCEPCFRMDEIQPGLQALLVGKRGMLARIITGGMLHRGDPITLL
jgi:MOSC domain-containing protein YiiM